MIVAAAALAAAAAAMVVALAYALYALLEPELGASGAAAVTAGGLALVALLIGLLFLRRSRPRHDEHHHPAAALAGMLPDRLGGLVRAQPLLALGALAVGAYVVLRRPGLLALVASSLLGMGAQKKIDKRRRR